MTTNSNSIIYLLCYCAIRVGILCIGLFIVMPGNSQTAIGGTSPNPSAMLDVQSTNRGVLFPRMSSTERNLIQNPASGLMIFNTSTMCLEINLGTSAAPYWQAIKCGGTISALNCNGVTVTGVLIENSPATGVTVSVPYTGGNGEVHQGQTVTSTVVTGLTATLSAGSFSNGSGNLTYTISGTPASTGMASFALNIGGQTCTITTDVTFLGAITTLDCTNAIRKGEMQPNFQADGVSVIVPYLAGDGGGYVGQTVASTGVTGYTATLAAGNFASGDGTLTYTITGTSSTAGTATFSLDIGGQICNLNLSVRSCSAKVSATETKIFHCYNLGAYNTRVDPFTPNYQINGGYWQWGRKAEAAAGPSGSDLAGANQGAIAGWNTTIAADNAWQDNTKTVNDPCPLGFRIPTIAQWEGVINADFNTIINATGSTWVSDPTNYNSGKNVGTEMFLPAPGFRDYLTGALSNRNNYGGYRSSTWSGTEKAWYIFFYGGNPSKGNLNPTHGASLRCIAE